jgi:hypothetical protein
LRALGLAYLAILALLVAQHFADRFGWENMLATVARVHQALPAASDEARQPTDR